MQLHTADGGRKYLTAGEREAFLWQAELADRTVRTLCMTLAYAGCRLSEALALTADRVDLAAGELVFESLKKRRSGIFCSVPVPPTLVDALDMVQGIRETQSSRDKSREVRLVVADDRLAGGASVMQARIDRDAAKLPSISKVLVDPSRSRSSILRRS